MSGPPSAISKEQKQLDTSIDITIQRLTDVKNALQAFLFKLENEALTWTSFNDSFALVSSHLTILNKSLKSDKTASFRSFGLLPLVLCQDLDAELQRFTEGRVPTFNHEVVPHHLRTKPEPEVELKEEQLTRRIFNQSLDAGNKQVNTFKRFLDNVLDTVSTVAASMDNHSDRQMSIPPTHSGNDTQLLMAAMTTGKGLKPVRGPGSGASTPSGHQGSPSLPTSSSPTPTSMSSSGGGGATLSNKMSSSVKTNLKAASNHNPYSRS